MRRKNSLSKRLKKPELLSIGQTDKKNAQCEKEKISKFITIIKTKSLNQNSTGKLILPGYASFGANNSVLLVGCWSRKRKLTNKERERSRKRKKGERT